MCGCRCRAASPRRPVWRPPGLPSARRRRRGSAGHDVPAQLRAVTELGLDPRHFLLVTDDSHSGTLINEGHMDRVVRHAIPQGADPVVPLPMATLNTAEHFGVSREGGQIAPGRHADILLANDLRDLRAGLAIP